MKNKLVQIVIQARSNSSRLPNKVHEKVGDCTILERVIDECNQSADFINRQYGKFKSMVKVSLAVPHRDSIVQRYQRKVHVFQGDEKDVLGRYLGIVRTERPDLVVRVTADCVFLPAFVVSRHIKGALYEDADYTSNVLIRTFMEGYDCEVISRRCLEYLDSASLPEEREHVTAAIPRLIEKGEFPFTIAHIAERLDLSKIKTSIDTKEDLARARHLHDLLKKKKAEMAKTGKVLE